MSAPTDREVLDRLVRIETKLDTALSDVADHENRIRVLEQDAMTEARVAKIVDEQGAVKQTSLRGWLAVALTAIGIFASVSTALFIAKFL